jgi:PKD repeat protein
LPAFTGPDNGNNLSVWARPTCSITAVPQNNIYTGGIPTNIYLGYGPQQVTLNTTATGGAPFSYSWTGNGTLSCYNCAAPVFAPTAAGVYDFTVTVSNANGCTTTCSIRICVTDIRVPGGSRVYVCHNGRTLSVPVNTVPNHVPGHNGDRLGRCDQQPCEATTLMITNVEKADDAEEPSFSISASPNPSSNFFNLQVRSSNTAPVMMSVTDMYGRVLFSRTNVDLKTGLRFGENLFSGTYLVNVRQGNTEKTIKIIKLE